MLKKRECLYRNGKVYFYVKLADLVEHSIKLSGKTPKKWLSDALLSYVKSLPKEKYEKIQRKQANSSST